MADEPAVGSKAHWGGSYWQPSKGVKIWRGSSKSTSFIIRSTTHILTMSSSILLHLLRWLLFLNKRLQVKWCLGISICWTFMSKYHALAGLNSNLWSDSGGRKLKMKVLSGLAPVRPLCSSCPLSVLSNGLALYTRILWLSSCNSFSLQAYQLDHSMP